MFIEVLVISGSILAGTNREKELIIWLAQRDQSVVGIGTVGFDIDEMPWTVNSFASEKDFYAANDFACGKRLRVGEIKL